MRIELESSISAGAGNEPSSALITILGAIASSVKTILIESEVSDT